MWDPGQYRQFADERSRPFYELIGRIGATSPGFVADIGCGPGELTADLARRWPSAEVLGVDNSPQMLAEALKMEAESGLARLRFEQCDAEDWEPGRPVDVIVSNALLQWIPDHEPLLVKWVSALSPGGWLAVQMPGNFDNAAHRLLREQLSSDRWRPLVSGVALNRQAGDPAGYLEVLAGAGCAVDAWETTYLQVLPGADPVLDWLRGTGLRPVMAALGEADLAEFLSEFGARLRVAYPAASYGTVFPFRRVFVVARKS